MRTGRPFTLLWVMLLVAGLTLWFSPFGDSITLLHAKLSWRPEGLRGADSHGARPGDEPLNAGNSAPATPGHAGSPSLTALPSPTAPSALHHDKPGLAQQLLAADLLARPLTDRSGAIPKLFHQSWKSLQLPGKFAEWSASCREKHADWEWVLWTDEDNLQLVQMHFPWLEEAYLALPGEIYRADLVRNLYMYTFGGVYADLDTECLEPTEKLLDQYGILQDDSTTIDSHSNVQLALLGRMGNDPSFKESVPNSWMASNPAHPFFLQLTEDVRQFVQRKKAKGFWDWSGFPSAEALTGPAALHDAIKEYEASHARHGHHLDEPIATLVRAGPWPFRETPHELIILPSTIIFPYSWGIEGKPVRDACWVLKDTFNATRCKERLGVHEMGSISITYWSHTHTRTKTNEKNLKYISTAEGGGQVK